MQQAETLGFHFVGENGRAGDIASRPTEAGYEMFIDWIAGYDHHNRNSGSCSFGRKCRWLASRGDDQRYAARDEIGRHRR
jgi:hypothetical protein